MKKSSPFRVWMRISGYCSMLSLAFCCWLFATSTSFNQMLLSCVVAVLLLALSVVVGFYFGIQRYRDKQAEAYVNHAQRTIHYPARNDFNRRIVIAAKDQTARITRIDTFA